MEKMKQGYGRFVKILLAAAMLVMMIGVTASAAGTAYVTMQKNENGVYVYLGEYDDYNTDVYHKVVVGSSGALVVSGNNIYQYSGTTGSINVTLYNDNFKCIDSEYGQWVDASNSKFAVYGVKPGEYYIKTSGDKNYVISAGFQKTTNKGGTSKKKARTIKHNTTVKGVMPAGEKSSATD